MKNTTDKTTREGKADLSSKLAKLFEDELKDIYWAEQALVKAIPKMIEKATSSDLSAALEHHLRETEGQITRVEKVFSLLGKKNVPYFLR